MSEACGARGAWRAVEYLLITAVALYIETDATPCISFDI